MRRASESGITSASVERCYEAIADFATYPEWQDAVQSTEILSTHPDGRGKDVEVTIDLKVRTVRYRLRYHHEPPHRLWWEYLGGDVELIEGEYRFEPNGTDTRIVYELGVETGFPVPGALTRRIASAAMARSIADLRERVEEP